MTSLARAMGYADSHNPGYGTEMSNLLAYMGR
jgi:hypothetical protein